MREQAHEFFKELNDIHSALNFTVEEETDGKLLFVDVLVECSDGKRV